MKTKDIIRILPLMFTMTPAFSQTAAERLEQGVQLQSADKNFTAAIAEYKEVLKASAKSQRLAAEARFRLVECFSELGNEARMTHHLEALRADFPADNKWVLKASSMGSKDWAFEGAPWQDGKLHTYEVRLPNGDVMGHYLIAGRKLDEEAQRWESIAIRSAGGRSISSSVFEGERYRFNTGRWAMDVFGDVAMKFEEGGKMVLVDSATGEDKGTYDHAASKDPQVPLFENEQMIQIIRALKHEIGTKQKSIICAAFHGGQPIPFDLEVTAHEEIETPAGKFSCAKIESSIKQTFWVSKGESRELVKINMGVANVNLVSSEDWNYEAPHRLRSREFGATVALPGAMLYCPPNVDKEVYRVQLWSSDFAGTWGMLEINKKSNLVEEAQKGSREYAKVLHEGYTKNLEDFKVSPDWDEIEINRVKGVGMKVSAKRGELNVFSYQVHVVGDEAAMTFRLEYGKPDEEKAIARAKEIVENFRW